MRSTLLWTKKSLAAFRLDSADSWKQLHMDKTSCRQISLVNVVVGLLGTDGVLILICLSEIMAEDYTAIISLFNELDDKGDVSWL